jgi:hypothetical protein
MENAAQLTKKVVPSLLIAFFDLQDPHLPARIRVDNGHARLRAGHVSVYLSEMATPGHKGFYVAWQGPPNRPKMARSW